jgi:hypothetical protein
MDGKTRRLVLETLNLANEEACRSLRADLELFAPEERRAVEESIEEFKACVNQQLEGTMQPTAVEERMAALIYGHSIAQSVQVMERYARTLNNLLNAAREHLTSTGKRRDN